VDGCLGEACDVCGAFAITGSLVFISVQRERVAGQEKIHAPGSTQLKRTLQGWLGSIPVPITYSTFTARKLVSADYWKKFALSA
jgi:hypothetical protein